MAAVEVVNAVAGSTREHDCEFLPCAAEVLAERLRVWLGYRPSGWWWRVDVSQLGWLGAPAGVVGVGFDGAVGSVYWSLLVASWVGLLLTRDGLLAAIESRAAAVARVELVPVAARLLEDFPETVSAIGRGACTEEERAAMECWARAQARRARRWQPA